MNILDQIIADKRKEVAEAKAVTKINLSPDFESTTYSLAERIRNATEPCVIAEFKRRSPSKGIINGQATVTDVVKGYEKAGASAVSVLTDLKYFQGTRRDLTEARIAIDIPILRKDFIIDEFQLLEAKAIRADVILLIASVLSVEETKEFGSFAKSLGLEVLLEIRDKEEIDHINQYVDIVGVNNRNLKDFTVNIDQSIAMNELIPKELPRISESALKDVDTIMNLYQHGYNGFLIGETFMKTDDPGNACATFLNQIKTAAKK